MATFKDANGRDWLVEVTVGGIEKVKSEAGLDLVDLRQLERLAVDPVSLCKVLCVLCDPESRGVSPEDFGRGLRGDAIEAAADALVDAILDFFPSSRRDRLRRLAEAGKRAAAAGESELESMLDDGTFERYLMAEAKAFRQSIESRLKKSSNTAGNSRES